MCRKRVAAKKPMIGWFYLTALAVNIRCTVAEVSRKTVLIAVGEWVDRSR